MTGLYHAREARHMSRSELVRLSGVSKQQLSRLENGLIRLRLDHLKPFAKHLGFTADQILLWGRYPGTGSEHIETSDELRDEGARDKPIGPSPGQVPELDTRTGLGGGGALMRKDGKHADPIKSEGWLFPASFVHEQLHTAAAGLLVLDTNWRQHGAHHPFWRSCHRRYRAQDPYSRRPLRHPRRVGRHRGQTPASDALDQATAGKNHFRQSEAQQRRGALNDLEIVGKILACLKLF